MLLFRVFPTIAWYLAALPLAVVNQPQPGSPPRILQADGKVLMQTRQRVKTGDAKLAGLIKDLCAQADKSLRTDPFTVTGKPKAPPSGDKHDYMSLAPYFWPNPDTKDGLPYIRKDGKRNPDIAKYDAPVMGRMSKAVQILSLAYYFTGEEKYAEHASRLLRVFFLDHATRMNPNFTHAQFVPGKNNGRGTGLIEARALLLVVDALGLLSGSPSWTNQDQAGVAAWMRDFLHWMRTSKEGKDEAAAVNNHGTWYDVQTATYALFLDDKATALQILEQSKSRRIAAQIEPKTGKDPGSLPREVVRANGYDYSQFDLQAFFALATVAESAGVDLWHFETDDGRGIRRTLDWLISYATGAMPWPYTQGEKIRPADMVPLLRRASVAYRHPEYEQATAKISDRREGAITRLLYPSPK